MEWLENKIQTPPTLRRTLIFCLATTCGPNIVDQFHRALRSFLRDRVDEAIKRFPEGKSQFKELFRNCTEDKI